MNSDRRVTRADVAAVLDAHPTLSAQGMGHGGGKLDPVQFDTARRRLLDTADEVQLAVDWLQKHPEAEGSSYRLKHDVERDSCAGKYVSNGAMIVALILLGWPLRGDANCGNPVVEKTRRVIR